jgi:diketogulonate reductase-like aldo/keto reductase
MKKKPFGINKTLVPVIGQGTWEMPEQGPERDQAAAAIKAGIEHGLVHIDTAEMYGAGKSEELIGKVIKDFRREDLFIVSKVLPDNATFQGTINACEKSLSRLSTDYLDCYLLHWHGKHPLKDTMRALEKLVTDGKIRSLGVSNFDMYDLEEAAGHLEKEKISCNQVLYNLYERGIERKLISYCKQKSISVVAYTPFGQRPLPDKSTADGVALAGIAAKHGATVAQVVLAFLTREENVFTIPKAAKVSHALDNAGAGDLELDSEDIATISKAFPAPTKDVPLATL